MPEQHRPVSVQAFEWLSIASLIYEMVTTESQGIFGDLLASGLWLGLVLWITRGRSTIARIVYTATSAFAVVGIYGAFRFGFMGPDASLAPVIWAVAQVAGLLALLWWPATTVWLKTKSRPSPSVEANS